MPLEPAPMTQTRGEGLVELAADMRATLAVVDISVNNACMAEARKPASARRLPPADRRRQLVACAVSACADRGLGRTNHAAVAERAGVSVPTVFHYFPNRDTLVAAVLAEVQRFFLELAREAHTGGGAAAERMVAHGRRFLDAARQHTDYLRVWLDWSTAVREETWPGYLEFQERLVAIVADSIGRDPRHAASQSFRPEDAARLFVGNAHMAAMMYFAPEAGIDLDEHICRTVALVLGQDG
jgi:TetR/AcrR family hemagglutinin/protease transcriptional regulator